MIRLIIQLYIFIIVAHIIVSYIPELRYKPWALKMRRLVDFTANPIRRSLPADMPFDFSPLIVIILLELFVALF